MSNETRYPLAVPVGLGPMHEAFKPIAPTMGKTIATIKAGLKIGGLVAAGVAMGLAGSQGVGEVIENSFMKQAPGEKPKMGGVGPGGKSPNPGVMSGKTGTTTSPTPKESMSPEQLTKMKQLAIFLAMVELLNNGDVDAAKVLKRMKDDGWECASDFTFKKV